MDFTKPKEILYDLNEEYSFPNSAPMKEDYTLQYADSSDGSNPVVKLSHSDYSILMRLGIDSIYENKLADVSELDSQIHQAFEDIYFDVHSGIPSDDFNEEREVLRKLQYFVNKAKVSHHKTIMLTADLANDEKSYFENLPDDLDHSPAETMHPDFLSEMARMKVLAGILKEQKK